jgi:hypothetical protein
MIRFKKDNAVVPEVVPVVPRVSSAVVTTMLEARIIVPASGLVLYGRKPKPWKVEGLSRSAWYRRRVQS